MESWGGGCVYVCLWFVLYRLVGKGDWELAMDLSPPLLSHFLLGFIQRIGINELLWVL